MSQAERRCTLTHELVHIERRGAEHPNPVVEISDLKKSLTIANQRMWASIGYNRVLRDSHRKHAPHADLPEVPEQLRDLI
ncbi:hypothetical protein [Gordonia sp. FQ]|uniref:hypothetical protein n=1 Tax=Gordonia sp. FQ TaxID=3446634 RepID=UPI003F82FD1A